MKKFKHNPITRPPSSHKHELYRGTLHRTMAGYKLISGTFLFCGCLAVPTLLCTGEQGVPGAIAITVASLLPFTIQTILVPHYVSRITIDNSRNLSPYTLTTSITKQTNLEVSYFSLFGIKTSRETIQGLKEVKSLRWVNYRGNAGRNYYIDNKAHFIKTLQSRREG